ncbi:carboxypeptidase regulatory-like domain-containing protein [Acanthopleuribacter pedis]|uniref:Carboxypeptidase regulatory-like domain-containing protein n=1 Tax=Acanthopleuribacter pedis TaxID=442870 RepID=A0A8J7Q5I8_9BACT|nr:carboxypeptidase regulatory-like domain-containing protein [Acanthopleuribacter pedis]MBO1319485.1 carboxypeptidase regulatory-like domain-containing protein [Acanthopleuribacter pedis]
MPFLWILLTFCQAPGDSLTRTVFVQEKSGLRLEPERQAVLLDPEGPDIVFQLSNDGGFSPEMRFQAALTGPGLSAPHQVDVPAQEGRILLPRSLFAAEGVFRLVNVRLTRGDNLIAFSEPAAAEIQVAENFLVSEVQVTPLSQQDLIDRGYLFSDEDYYTVEFEMALMIGSKEENVSVPVAFPKKNSEAFQPVILQDPFKPYVRLLTFPFSGDDYNIPLGASPDPPASQSYMPGLILIPGNFNYLKSHFDVTCLVLNAAPEGFDVRVNRLQARLRLPDPTRYGNPLTVKESVIKPMLHPGEDGELETADDREFILPTEKAEASYVVIGNIPGMYDVEVEVTGNLQLPQETQEVSTLTRGQIFVRSPEFSVTFEHPDAVAENEVYNLIMNIDNRGEIPLEGFSVTLDPDTLVGCELFETHPVQSPGSIAVGGTGQVVYRLRSLLSGTVISSYFKVDGAVQGALNLRVGVGEIGQRISPYVVNFPEVFHAEFPVVLTNAIRQYAKAGLDVSQATPEEVPDGLLPVSAPAVREFNELAVFAARIGSMGFSDGEQLVRLFSLWTRGVREYEPLDRVRRAQIMAGTDNPETAFAQAFNETLGGQSPDELVRLLARENEETPHVFAVMLESSVPVDLYLNDVNQTLAANRTTPYSALLPLTPTKTLFWLHGVSETPRLQVRPRGGDRAAVSLAAVYPDGEGGMLLSESGNVAFSATLDIGFDPAERRMRLLPGGGLPQNREGVAVAPKAFEMLQIRHMDPQILPSADIYGRDFLITFTKPLDLNSLDPIEEHVFINGRPAVDAKLQRDGLNLIVSSRMPLGPYHPISYEIRDPRAKSGESLSTQSGTIEGSPWYIGCSITGRVVDRNRSDLSKAKIFHWKRDWTNPSLNLEETEPGEWRIFETISLDEEGRFFFPYSPFPAFAVKDEMDLRTLKIGVLLEDGRYEEREFHPAGAGQNLIAEFAFLQQGEVRGYVRDAEGAPISGAAVYAVNQNNQQSAVITETDENGFYRAVDLEVGQILVKSANAGIVGYASGYLTQTNSPLTVDVVIDNPSGDISGRITVNDNGTIRPRENAIVAFVQQNGLVGHIRLGGEDYPYSVITTTDADGRYTLEDVPAGNGYWWVWDLNYRYFERLMVVNPDDQLTENHEYDGTPPPTGSVGGLVRNRFGNPVEGARVTAGGQLTVTGADGRFLFQYVEQGTNITVRAEHDDYGSGTFSLVLDVPSRDDLIIELRERITISGRFVDADGNPKAFADIYNPPYPMIIVPIAQTDAQGYWTATLPEPGTYAITTVDWPHIAALENLSVGDTGAQDLLLQQWATADLRVRLVNESGQPVVAKVSVKSMRPEDFTLALGLPSLKLTHINQFTDANGEVIIRNLNIGNFEVWGESGLLGETDVFSGVLEEAADGAEPRTITLVFPDSLEPANLFGRVFDTDGVTPAPEGTVVQAQGPGIEARVATDAEGNYRFENLVQTDDPVRLNIIAGHPDSGLYDTAWMDLHQDLNFRYDMILRTKGTARISVVNGDGTPVDAAAVEVSYRDVYFVPPTEPGLFGEMGEEPVRETGQITATQRSLDFGDIPTGPFTVRVSSGNGLVGLRSYVIPVDGGTVPLTVKLEASSRIDGLFLTHQDNPIPDAEIQLLAFNRLLQQRLTSSEPGEEGRFSFPDLPMRTYRLNGTDPATALQGNLEVTTSPYQPIADVTLRLDPVGDLEGLVLHEGNPVPNAQITLVRRGLKIITGSDAEGRYRFRNLALGDYEISAASPSVIGKVKTGVTLEQAFTVTPFDIHFGKLFDVDLFVESADGLPVSQMLVTAENLDYRQVVGNSAYTDENGIARLADLPVGTYRISGSHPTQSAPLSGRFTLTDADPDPAARSVRFNGWGSISGHVRDTTGSPLSQPVHVNFEYRLNGIRDRITITTDGEGYYRAGGMPTGVPIQITAYNQQTQEVANRTVTLDNHGQEHVEDLTFRASTFVTGTVRLSDGTPAVGASVWVTSPYYLLVQADELGEFYLSPILDGETTIYAKAADSERKVAHGVQIEIVDGLPQPINGLELTLSGVAGVSGSVSYHDGSTLRTGSVTLAIPELDETFSTLILGDGTYSFNQIPLGTWELSAHDRKFAKTSETFTVVADGDGATLTQDITFQPSFELTGRLMDTSDFNPVAGGLVELWRPNPNPHLDPELIYAAESDPDGYFRIQHVYPGDYQLVAEDAALTGSYTLAFTMPNQDLDLANLTLRTRAWILGTISDGDNDPYHVGSVSLTQNGRLSTYRIQPDGSFEFNGLEPGPYSLTYSLNNGWTTGATSGLLSAGVNTLPIVTGATHSVSGTAILLRDPPAPPWVRFVYNGISRSVTLNAAGDFVLDGVPDDGDTDLMLSYGAFSRVLPLGTLTGDRDLGTLYLDTTPPSLAFADEGATVSALPFELSFQIEESDAQSEVNPAATRVWVNGSEITPLFHTDQTSIRATLDRLPDAFLIGANELEVETANLAGASVRRSFNLNVDLGGITLTVDVRRNNQPFVGQVSLDRGGWQNTDAEGRVVFSGVSIEAHTLRARGDIYGTRLHYLAGGAVNQNVVLSLHQYGAYTGRLIDDGGQPVSGTRIEIGEEGEHTGPDGTFLFDFLPLGNHQLTAHVNGRHAFLQPRALDRNGESVAVGDMVLEGAGTVVGVVYDNDGTTPIADAEVTLSFAGLPDVFRRQTVSAADGSFTLTDVLARSFELTAYQPTSERRGFAAGTLSDHGQTVNVPILLSPAGDLVGILHDADGNPAVGLTLGMTGNGFNFSAVTADDGGFAFTRVPYGSYTLAAESGDGLQYIQFTYEVDSATADLGVRTMQRDTAPEILAFNVPAAYDLAVTPRVRMTARDDRQIREYRLIYGGVLTQTSRQFVYRATHDSNIGLGIPATTPEGTLTYTLEVEDHRGQVSRVSGTTEVVFGGEGPELTMNQPQNGAAFIEGDSIQVEVSVHDPAGIDRVEAELDGVPQGSNTSYPYGFTITAPGVSQARVMTLSVTAFNVRGLSTTLSRDLVISPISSIGGPAVTLLAPEHDLSLPLALTDGLQLHIAGRAEDEDGLENASVTINGEPVYDTVLSGTSALIETAYTLTEAMRAADDLLVELTVTDLGGNPTTAIARVNNLPLPADAEIFNAANVLTLETWNRDHEGKTIVLAGGAHQIDGEHAFADLILVNGASLGQTATDSNGDNPAGTNLELNGRLVVDYGSRIDLDGMGYPNMAPGHGHSGWRASHAGLGQGTTDTRLIYGSPFRPQQPGSGLGGGALRVAASEVWVLGRISADSHHGNRGLSGSGGSIWLTGEMFGKGHISANGYAGDYASSNAGGGGGGRIALYGAFGGTVTAFGGRGAGAGSVYFWTADPDQSRGYRDRLVFANHPEASGTNTSLIPTLENRRVGEHVFVSSETQSNVTRQVLSFLDPPLLGLDAFLGMRAYRQGAESEAGVVDNQSETKLFSEPEAGFGTFEDGDLLFVDYRVDELEIRDHAHFLMNNFHPGGEISLANATLEAGDQSLDVSAAAFTIHGGGHLIGDFVGLGDLAVTEGYQVRVTGNLDFNGNVTLLGGDLIVNGSVTASALDVASAAVVATPEGVVDAGLHLHADAMTIDGEVRAHDNGNSANGDNAYYGSHGGLGGYQVDYAVHKTFGNLYRPVTNGAGNTTGHRPGGRIRLSFGTLDLNGAVNVNGTYRHGAGGSILLEGNNLSGTGTLNANGSATSIWSAGGGRIGVLVNDINGFSGNATAFGGPTGVASVDYQGGAGTVFYRTDDLPNGRLVLDNNGTITRPLATPLPGLGQRTAETATGGGELLGSDFPALNGLGGLYVVFADGSEVAIAENSETQLQPVSGGSFPVLAQGDTYSGLHILDVLEVRGGAQLQSIDAIRIVQDLIVDGGTLDVPNLALPADFQFTDGAMELYQDPGFTSLELNNFQLTTHFEMQLTELNLNNGASLTNDAVVNADVTRVTDGDLVLQGTLRGDSLIVGPDGVVRTIAGVRDGGFTIDVTDIDIAGAVRAHHNANATNHDNRFRGSHGGFGGFQTDFAVHRTYGNLYQPDTAGSGDGLSDAPGGRIRMQFTNLNLTGTIDANGRLEQAAGGSVLLSGQTLTGDGGISANGAATSIYAGGGGRIALLVENVDGFSGPVTAFGGKNGVASPNYWGGAGTVFYRNSTWPNGRLVLDNNDIETRPGSTLLPGLGNRTAESATGGDVIDGFGYPEFNDLAGLYAVFPDGSEVAIGSHTPTQLLPREGLRFPELAEGEAYSGLHIFDVLEIRGKVNLKSIDAIRVLEDFILGDGSVDVPDFQVPSDTVLSDGSIELFVDPGYTNIELDNFHLTVHFPMDLTNLRLTNGSTLTTDSDIYAAAIDVVEGEVIINGTLAGETLTVAENGVIRTPLGQADAGLGIEVPVMNVAGVIRAHHNPNGWNDGNRYRSSHGGYGGSDTNFDVHTTFGSLYQPNTNGASGRSSDEAGGRIRLSFTTLDLSGEINADGTVQSGAGGSVMLNGQTLTGSGDIRANGAATSIYAGGGGRVAVMVEDLNGYTGAVTAFGGRNTVASPNYQGGAGTVFYRNSTWPNGRLVLDNNGTETRTGSTELPGLGERTADGDTGGGVIAGTDFPAFSGLTGLYVRFGDGSSVAIDTHTATELTPVSGSTFPVLAGGEPYSGLHILDELVVRGNANLKTLDALQVNNTLVVDSGSVDAGELSLPPGFSFTNGALTLFADPGLTELNLDGFHLTVHFPLNLTNLTLSNGSSLTSTVSMQAQTTVINDGELILNGTLSGQSLNLSAAGTIRTPSDTADAGLMLDVTEMEIAGTIQALYNGNSDNPGGRYNTSHGGYGGAPNGLDYSQVDTYGSLYQPQTNGTGQNADLRPGGRVHLRFDSLTHTGAVNVDGSEHYASGGSILLEGNSLSGGGSLSANGSGGYVYTGGGGRIAVLVADQAGFSGTATAFGGLFSVDHPLYNAGAGTVFYRDSARWPNGRLVVNNNGTPSPTGSTELPGLGERTAVGDTGGDVIAGSNFPTFSSLTGLHLLFADESTVPIASHGSDALSAPAGNPFPALVEGDTYSGVHILDVLEISGGANLRTIDGVRVLQEFVMGDGTIDTPDLDVPVDGNLQNGSIELFEDPGYTRLELDNFHLIIHYPVDVSRISLINGATLVTDSDVTAAEVSVLSGSITMNGTLTTDDLNVSGQGIIQTPAGTDDARLIINAPQMQIAGSILAHDNGQSFNPENIWQAGHGGRGGNRPLEDSPPYGNMYRPATNGVGTDAGGAIRLNFTSLNLTGSINANGRNGQSSGGSVLLEGETLTGSGTISADGGNDYWNGAGGGRIALWVNDQAEFAGAVHAHGGQTTINTQNYNGGAGTVYRRSDIWPNGYLTVDNNDLASRYTTTELVALGQREVAVATGGGQTLDGDNFPLLNGLAGMWAVFDDGEVLIGDHGEHQLTAAEPDLPFPDLNPGDRYHGLHLFDVLEVRGNAHLKTDDHIRVLQTVILAGGSIDAAGLELPAEAPFTEGSIELFTDPGLGQLTLNSFNLVSHFPWNLDSLHLSGDSTLEPKASITVSETLTVDAGSSIIARDRGLAENPGNVYRSGHGGYGGNFDLSAAVTFGNLYEPTTSGRSHNNTPDAGGAMELRFDTLVLNGRLDADGSGRGAGGAILLRGGTLTGGGSISADGGKTYWETGGGGRIAIHVEELTAFEGQVSALGGRADANRQYSNAGAGTVFYRNSTWPNGRLVIDNNGLDTRPGTTELPGLGEVIALEPTGDGPIYGENFPAFSGLSNLYLVFEDGSEIAIGDHTENELFAASGSFPFVDEGQSYRGLHIFDVLEIRGNAQLKTVDTIRVLDEFIFESGSVEAAALEVPVGSELANGSMTLYTDPGLSNLTLDNFQLVARVPIATTNLQLRNGATLELNAPLSADTITVDHGCTILARDGGSAENSGNRFRASHGGYGGNFDFEGVETLGNLYTPTTHGRSHNTTVGAGGALQLSFNTLTLNGDLDAAGTGQGAGGSIYLQGDTLDGGGNINANGGQTYWETGGGGRVAIHVEDLNAFEGRVTAWGGRADANRQYSHAGAGTVFYRNSTWPNGRLIVDNNGLDTRPGSTKLPGLGEVIPAEPTGGAVIHGENFPPFGALGGLYLVFEDGSEVAVGNHGETELFPASGSFPLVDEGQGFRGLHILDVLEIRGNGQLKTADSIRVLQQFIFESGSIEAAGLELPADSELTNGAMTLYTDPGLDRLILDNFQLDLRFPVDLADLELRNGATLELHAPMNAGTITVGAGTTIFSRDRGQADNTGNRFRSSHGGYGGNFDYDTATTLGNLYTPTTAGRSFNTTADAGGAIELTFDTLTLDGTLDVSGSSQGSGGSVLLRGNQLTGAGNISADGGNTYWEAGGGGRIALHVEDLDGYSGAVSAYGGHADVNRAYSNAGAGTVFYRNSTWPNGRLVVDNRGIESRAGSTFLPGVGEVVPAEPTGGSVIDGENFPEFGGLNGLFLIFTDGSEVRVGDHTTDQIYPAEGTFPLMGEGDSFQGLHILDVLEVRGGAQLKTDDALRVLDYFVFESGSVDAAWLDVPADSTFTNGSFTLYADPGLDHLILDNYQMNLQVSLNPVSLELRNNATLELDVPLQADTMTVDAGCRIFSRDRGRADNSDNRYRSSHGGYGGNYEYDTASTLGNLYQPETHGRSHNTTPDAGGALDLRFTTLTLNGDLDVNGSSQGAGGSIYLRGDVLSGSGNISADGGHSYWEAGGGGRIALHVEDLDAYEGAVTAYGGHSDVNREYSNAGAGTVFYRNSTWPNGRLVVDNRGVPTRAGSTTLPGFGSLFLEVPPENGTLEGNFAEFNALAGLRVRWLSGSTQVIANTTDQLILAENPVVDEGESLQGYHLLDVIEVRGGANLRTVDGFVYTQDMIVEDGAVLDATFVEEFGTEPSKRVIQTPPAKAFQAPVDIPTQGDLILREGETRHLKKRARFGAIVIPPKARLIADDTLTAQTISVNGGRLVVHAVPEYHEATLRVGELTIQAGSVQVASLRADWVSVAQAGVLTGNPTGSDDALLFLDAGELVLAGRVGRGNGETRLIGQSRLEYLSADGATFAGTLRAPGGRLVDAVFRGDHVVFAEPVSLEGTHLQTRRLEAPSLRLNQASSLTSLSAGSDVLLSIDVAGELNIGGESSIRLDGVARRPGNGAHGGLPFGFHVRAQPADLYGSPVYPTLPGNGSAGGGVLHLGAARLHLDGRISARGVNRSSGGSVLLRVGQFSGNGTVDVAGGVADQRFESRRVYAGGGRVAVHARDSAHFTGRIVTGNRVETQGSLVFVEPGTEFVIAATEYRGGRLTGTPPAPRRTIGLQQMTQQGERGLAIQTRLRAADVAGMWLRLNGKPVRILQAADGDSDTLYLQLAEPPDPGDQPASLELRTAGGAR